MVKETAKEKVYNQLVQLTLGGKLVATEEIALSLGISRQNTSHYLARLQEDGLVEKQGLKPVLWKVSKKNIVDDDINAPFSNIIGFQGSLATIIKRCISAVKYPPKGLNLMITGETGVGKSYLAEEVYQFAKSEKAISEDAPFLILNCADYADNPELLTSILFGHKKGAFTGAEKDTDGLLASADTGYLFLDEIHRLSSENQEKLFWFMDSGQYRRLGESSSWLKADVRFIFATTEKREDVLLETFRRRIELTVKVPSFSERPVEERLELIELFGKNEAQILGKDIVISNEALQFLLSQPFLGNVGGLKSLIKISCANAYSLDIDANPLKIGELDIKQLSDYKPILEPIFIPDDLVIKYGESESSHRHKYFDIDGKLKDIAHLVEKEDTYRKIAKIQQEVQSLVAIINQNSVKTKIKELLTDICQRLWEKIIIKKYGIVDSAPVGKIGSLVYANLPAYTISLEQPLKILKQQYPRSAYVTGNFITQLPIYDSAQKNLIELIVLIMLVEYIDEKISLKGLLLAHGDSTASSIQSVINQLCGNYIFEAIDMPIESNVSEIVESTIDFVHQQVNSDSLVVIVDMGSLSQIYTQIKHDLRGELLLINNLTTAVALDIGLKMSLNSPFKQIAEDASEKYSINVQYFEGFARNSNIIISCMSGVGISEKLKEIFNKHLTNDSLEIFAKEYRDLRNLVDQNDEHYFEKTKLVITTSDLPKTFEIPNVNIYDVLEGEGSKKLESILSDELSHQEFLNLIQELVKFFSLEGIVNRLTFLNPDIVIDEVETIVAKFENYYSFVLSGKVKLNLYMHISIMMERLFLARTEAKDDLRSEMTAKEDEFYSVARSIFQNMEIKYNFKVNSYELSLLFELLGSFI